MKINLQTTLILIALSAFSLPSYARVYEYVFKDVYGTDKSVSAEAGILNTNEKIQVRIISGLDRKIQVTVKKDNVGVYSFTTESVTVNDRIKASTGEEFYGKTLTLPPLSDGSYVITSDILNTQNTVIDSTSHNFIIDTVGPLSDNLSVDQNPGYDMVLTGERWELGLGAEAKLYLNVKNVKSATGFDKATIQVIKPDDTVFSTTDMVYDSGSASLSIPWTKGNMSRSSWMPVSNADVEYRFRVTLYDKAGNHKVLPDQKFIFDSDLGEYTLFAVYDPTSKTSVVPGFSEGYIAYKPGMTVNQNPLTLVYSYVSAKTAYKVAYVIHNGYQWGGGSLSYNINLGSEAPASPAAPEVWLTSDIKGEMNAGSYLWDSKDLPVKFSSVKITASPRNYGQRAMSGNTEICQIPAGETECTGAVSWSIPKSGNGITTYFFRLTDMDKTLSSVTVEKRHHWNTDLLPKITGYSYQEENKTVLLFVTQPGRGKFRDLLQLKSAALIDSDTGDQLLSGIQTALSGEDYTYSFDLSKLAEGKYNLGFLAKDSFNNETSSPFINLINDKTPPVVNFKYENAPLSPGATVFGLENISITLNDELTAPSLVRLELKGGPASDSVILGFNQNTDGSYTPDYPRLFPSLDANTDKYTLTAYATDAKGNTTQKSIQFAYYPKNLVTLEKLKTLGVVKALKTSDNTPLAVMRTGQLRRNDGSLAKGIQTANITVRKDADYAINILGNVIHPGETKEIQIDLGTGENSTVPIFTAENGSTGESNFIIEFPQIK